MRTSMTEPTREPQRDPALGDSGILHTFSYRLNTGLFLGFLWLAVALGVRLPERYPVHFGLDGTPTRWSEGPGMWVFLVAVCTLSFLQLHLFQRFLVTNPDSTLLNVPHKKLFHQLPRERKIPVIRRANRVLGMLNTAMLLLFSAILLLTFYTAHGAGGVGARVAAVALPAIGLWIVVAPLVEAWGLSRMVKRKLVDEGLLE